MATLYITEFSSMAQIPGAIGQMAQEPPVAAYSIAIGVGSIQSQAFDPSTRFFELNTDSICSIAVGKNPTADATKRRMSANQTIFRGVPEGSAFKVAVITNS